MATDNSTYPLVVGAQFPTTQYTPPPTSRGDDPSYVTTAVAAMAAQWGPVDVCVGGSAALRANAKNIIPQEPRENDDAYNRRLFHATLAPFLLRLASQAAGIILRKGVQLDGPDYWEDWSKNVTGDGTTLNEYARRQLITAILWGHSSTIVDFAAGPDPATLAEERARGASPYLVPIHPRQILGWRTATDSASSELSQVRIREQVVEPLGPYGEQIVDQIRVMQPGTYEVWRTAPRPPGFPLPATTPTSWALYDTGTTSLDSIPLVTLYSNRTGNLLSSPPLLEVANLNIAYAQRFTDYHHAIHVGANPILALLGFDPETDTDLGLSANTAICLPPDGNAFYVQPTSEAFDAQLKCLQALEDQISRLGINTLTAQNLTNAAAEARRLDRIDSDSIMAVIAGDLERTIETYFTYAGAYVGVEPPRVTIPRDYDNRLVTGNEITAYLQLFMQGAISQETLLNILQTGEVLPANIDVGEEITRTQDMLEEAQALTRLQQGAPDMAFQAPVRAGQGESLTSQTLPTPLRPGRNPD